MCGCPQAPHPGRMEPNGSFGRPRGAFSVLGAIGVALAIVGCVGALFYVGFMVILVIGLNQLGSNK